MKKILGIGNALVDVMTMINDDSILKKFGLPKGSMQLVDREKSEMIRSETSDLRKTMTSGGSAANTIHGLAMLGAKAGYIGSIGKDELGEFYENDMKSAGVSTMMTRRDSMTGISTVFISPDSERTFATHLGAAVELIARDLRPDWFNEYDILYIEGYLINDRNLFESACKLAKHNNMKVAIDLASYNVVGEKLSDFKEIVEKYADIVFANEDEAKAFTGLAPKEALDSISKLCEIAVVKAGSEGSWVKRGEEIIKIGTGKVSLIDTTGAGDLYAAGFLYGYARDQNLEICGQYGSILSAHVIEILGARMDDKRWQKIRATIAELA